MARYSIEFAHSVQKDLRKIERTHVPRLLTVIEGLADEPRPPGSKKLTGEELFRLRVGNYRIVYEVIDRRLVVLVIKVGHRKDVYR